MIKYFLHKNLMTIIKGGIIMSRKKTQGNYYVEKMEFLPDDVNIAVARNWCFYVATFLNSTGNHENLYNLINKYISTFKKIQKGSIYVPGYITMSVGDARKLVDVCGTTNFCCAFPCDYDDIANEFLTTKLGVTKDLILSLISDNKVEAAFDLIDTIEDDYLRKLSLLYMREIYNTKEQTVIETFKNTRRRTINNINSRLY